MLLFYCFDIEHLACDQDEKKGRKGTKFQPIIDSNVDLEDFDIADLLKARDLLR